MARQPPKQWSYTSGEKGRNRVRAFAHPVTGRMFLEFREAGRRTRVALGHRNCEAAKVAAERAGSRYVSIRLCLLAHSDSGRCLTTTCAKYHRRKDLAPEVMTSVR